MTNLEDTCDVITSSNMVYETYKSDSRIKVYNCKVSMSSLIFNTMQQKLTLPERIEKLLLNYELCGLLSSDVVYYQ